MHLPKVATLMHHYHFQEIKDFALENLDIEIFLSVIILSLVFRAIWRSKVFAGQRRFILWKLYNLVRYPFNRAERMAVPSLIEMANRKVYNPDFVLPIWLNIALRRLARKGWIGVQPIKPFVQSDPEILCLGLGGTITFKVVRRGKLGIFNWIIWPLDKEGEIIGLMRITVE